MAFASLCFIFPKEIRLLWSASESPRDMKLLVEQSKGERDANFRKGRDLD